MKDAKKMLCLILCILLFVLALSACSGNASEDETAETPLPMTDEVRLLLSGYTLVRPDICEKSVVNAAVALRDLCNLSITTDFVRRGDPVPEDNIELLIGDTNRTASLDALAALQSFRGNNVADYLIRISENKIVIVGASDAATVAAVEHFMTIVAPRLTQETIAAGKETVYRREYARETIAGRSAGDYTILIPDTEEAHALAAAIGAAITEQTGFVLPVSTENFDTPAVISLGAVGTAVHEAAVRELTEFRSNCYADWMVRTDANGIVCAGVTQEGSAAAVDYFQNTAFPALSGGDASHEYYSRKEYDMLTLNETNIGDYVIAIPKEPSIDIINAADEIRAYVLEAAGYDLPILREGEETDAPKIRLLVEGEMRPTADIAFAGSDLVISGGHYYPVAQAAKELLSVWKTAPSLGADYHNTLTFDSVPLTSARYPDMKLIWNDEFDDDTDLYDRMKWLQRAQMSAADVLNSTTERNVKTENGNLVLRSWKEDEAEVGMPYSTNMSMTTRDSCNYCYGYLEMRAKVPFGKGAWPSFWMVQREDMRAEGQNWNAEIDIFEVFGSRDRLVPNIHKWYDSSADGYHVMVGSHRQTYYVFKDIENLSDEYHTYGFYWDETKMIFSVDGEDYCEMDITEESGDFGNYPGMSGFHTPNYIILNNFLFTPKGSWVPDGAMVDDTVSYPVTYTIDYIRLWQGENGIFRAPNLEEPENTES